MTRTNLDRSERHPGYWPSSWPVECGGNRRQKASPGRLDAAAGTAQVTTSKNDRWNVMVIERDPDEWFVGGTMAAFSGPPPFGWVQRIDAKTLAPLASSPELPCGEHVWCGAILAHSNGSIHSINGSYLHRLDPDRLTVQAELALPADRAHNGLLSLSDGSLITKDLRLEGQGGTTITRLDPDTLEIRDSLVLPEGSMGRIGADRTATGDHVYVPGTEHLWRIDVTADAMTVDEWQPRYRTANSDWGLAWDSCVSDGAAWIMDCGDIESVRMIHQVEPQWPLPPNLQAEQCRGVETLPGQERNVCCGSRSTTRATSRQSSPSARQVAASLRHRSTCQNTKWPSLGTPSTAAWPASALPRAP